MIMQQLVGIDEVGRGAWAGPLVVVAAKQIKKLPVGLKDSKLLTKNRREALLPKIIDSCQLGLGWIEPTEIDTFGLSGAMKLCVDRALKNLGVNLEDAIVMDGNVNYCPPEFTNVTTVVRADSLFPVVSAASIFAKVTRDNYMKRISLDFPGYGFDKHVGYGTRLHLEMLKKHGRCSQHRVSFKPVAGILYD